MKKTLLLLAGIFILTFSNCAKPDLEFIELENGVHFGKKQLTIKRVNAKEAATHLGIKKFINKVQGKKITARTLGSLHQRNENEVETFTLQMTDIVMIEKGSYTSFTFAVLKDNDDGKMENVTVNYYTNGDIKAYLVVYDINDYEKELLRQGITISLDEKTKTFLLENLVDNESEQNEIVARLRDVKMCTQWVTQNTICKGKLKHDITNFFECEYFQNGTWTPVVTTLEFVPCPDGGGGSGGGDGGYNPPGDDYPVGGGPDNDDPAEEDEFDGQITWPVIPKHHFKNCEKLSEQSQAIGESLNDLSIKAGLNDKEYGYFYNYENGNYTSTEICNHPPCIPLSSNAFTIPFPLGQNAVAVAHTHPDDGLGYLMFSPQDVQYLWALALRHQPETLPKDASVYTLYLVTERGNYALKIDNVLQFHSFMTANYNEEFIEKLNDEYNTLDPEEDIALQEKVFLNFIKKEMTNSGISVYKSQDNTFSNWNRLELNENENLNPIPCN
ncbi:hypothetical protein [Flavobacterium sp.]|uniref:hypothetical protein n=1 Tax=Flavobacterium sp. TaxID=239 RepID=UPI002FDB5E72